MTAPAIPAFPALPEAPTLGTNACQGTSVIVTVDPVRGGYAYLRCPGCAGCDREAVRERMAPKLAGRDPFARLPKIDEEEW